MQDPGFNLGADFTLGKPINYGNPDDYTKPGNYGHLYNPNNPNDLYRVTESGKYYSTTKYDASKGYYPKEDEWNEIKDDNVISMLQSKDSPYKPYAIPETKKEDNSVNNTNTDMTDKIYNADMSNIDQSKKFIIGSGIARELLNTANIANAWGKNPASIGIAPINNVELPSDRDAELSELRNATGRYRSGIRRQVDELGLHPSIMIGAEANVLSNELGARGQIAERDIKNTQTERLANSDIQKQNVSNQYTAQTTNAARMDEIAKNRSMLFSQGLSQAGSIGSNVGENLLKINNMQSNEAVMKYALEMMQKATNQRDAMYWYSIYSGHGGDANKWNYDMTPSKTGITTQNK